MRLRIAERIRQYDDQYILTIKSAGLMERIEVEKELTEEEFNELSTMVVGNLIQKDRYKIPLQDSLILELDVFHGNYEGVVFAEIEFKSEDQAKSIHMPDWFYKEITDEVSNDKMSKGEFKYMDGLML